MVRVTRDKTKDINEVNSRLDSKNIKHTEDNQIKELLGMLVEKLQEIEPCNLVKVEKIF